MNVTYEQNQTDIQVWQKLRKTNLYLGYLGLLLLACLSCNFNNTKTSELINQVVLPQSTAELTKELPTVIASPHPKITISRNAYTPHPNSDLEVSSTLVVSSGTQILRVTSVLSSPKEISNEPDIPTVVKQIYFGVPAGNGYHPGRVAVDSPNHKVYTFNSGLYDEGNTISVLDTEIGEFKEFLKLNNPQRNRNPKVRALEIDPYRSQLYALWSGSDGIDNNLTIINTEELPTTKTISNVITIVPASDRLYLVNDTHLWAVDTDFKTLIERNLAVRDEQGSLLFDPLANRLYLVQDHPFARDNPNLIEIFSADSLVLLGSYETDGKLIGAAVDSENGQLLVVERHKGGFILQALDTDGKPLNKQIPISLDGDAHFNLHIIVDKQDLYIVEEANKVSRLSIFSLPDLTRMETVPLDFYPDDLVFDILSGNFYAPNISNNYILELNPETSDTRQFHTYLSVVGALVDPDTNRLYVLNEQGTLRVLDATYGNELTKIETGIRLTNDFGLTHLSLDPTRRRLYIDTGWYVNYVEGNQLLVVDTQSLTITHRLDLIGQVTPDPSSDRIYVAGKSCSVQIIHADTWEEMGMIFPFGTQEPPPPMGPCVRSTSLDSDNQILYALGSYCSGGSSCGGLYSSIYDVSNSPEYISYIRNQGIGFDSESNRIFTSDFDDGYPSLSRFEIAGHTISQTQILFGVGGSSKMFYDSKHDKLYTGNGSVFDGDLTLLVEPYLSGQIIAFDSKGQHLYARDRQGNLYIITTSGGELHMPPQTQPDIDNAQRQEFFIAPEETYFGIYDGFLYRSYDKGMTWQRLGYGLPNIEVGTIGISPNYEQDQLLLVNLSYQYSGRLYRSMDGGDTWWPTTQGLR